MRDDPFEEDVDALRWQQAAAFVEVHGDAWPDEALANLKAVPAGDRDMQHQWIDLIDKMTEISQAPRQ